MKNQLTQVVKNKQKTKDELSYLKNRYIAIIYGGLAKGDKITDIHKKLYDETINQKKLGYETDGKILNYAYKVAKVLKKQSSVVDIEDLPVFIFELINKKKIEKNMYSLIVKQADKNEAESKDKILRDTMSRNIEKSRLKPNVASEIRIFYLASWHKDSASDHKDYQGKVYIDENWENIEMSYELKNAIKNYIRKYNVKTVQWVTGKPVWFVTRPNCRHYFKDLNVEEVLKNSKTTLLNKHEMRTAIGDRQYLQTIQHSTSKEWYNDIRNAQLLLKSYKERLELHKMMYKEKPSEVLANAITKDKLLIEKWEKYIESF